MILRSLRVKKHTETSGSNLSTLPTEHLDRDPTVAISFKQLNNLPENTKGRIYRSLLPYELMMHYGIDPITWKSTDTAQPVRLKADPGTNMVEIALYTQASSPDDIFSIQLSDNANNGIDLDFLQINDPHSPRFDTDRDQEGKPTLYGTARRNVVEERKAILAGLVPGQTRSGLRASEIVFEHLETFLVTLGHREYFLEPLTYASAWLFERRGFAYLRGHKLVTEIHKEFQPGRRLHKALDNSTPFRQADHWRTVRGRAWAIHDGILESIGARWDGLRMVKQIGKCAGVKTFPGAEY